METGFSNLELILQLAYPNIKQWNLKSVTKLIKLEHSYFKTVMM